MIGAKIVRQNKMKVSFYDIKNWLTDSSSPRKTALAITLGFYIGLFPVTGCTTLLCILATLLFKLNPLTIQGVNWLLAPFQLMLMYPTLKLGRILFFPEKGILAETSLGNAIASPTWKSVFSLGETVVGGIAVWGIFSILTGYFVYRTLLRISLYSLSLTTNK